jgi:aminopeptidase N
VLFHQQNGSGYRFVAQKIAELDKLNPQIASRLLGAFSPLAAFRVWRKATSTTALQQLSEQQFSNDTFETLNRLLNELM